MGFSVSQKKKKIWHFHRDHTEFIDWFQLTDILAILGFHNPSTGCFPFIHVLSCSENVCSFHHITSLFILEQFKYLFAPMVLYYK